MAKWTGGHSLPTIMAAAYKCMEILQILNSCNSYIYWYIDLKLAESFQNRVIHTV